VNISIYSSFKSTKLLIDKAAKTTRKTMNNQNNTEQEKEADLVRADLAANAAKAHWHKANDRAALIRQIQAQDTRNER